MDTVLSKSVIEHGGSRSGRAKSKSKSKKRTNSVRKKALKSARQPTGGNQSKVSKLLKPLQIKSKTKKFGNEGAVVGGGGVPSRKSKMATYREKLST